jgi:hypothetical protein
VLKKIVLLFAQVPISATFFSAKEKAGAADTVPIELVSPGVSPVVSPRPSNTPYGEYPAPILGVSVQRSLKREI